MKVLITGSAGLIGSSLYKFFALQGIDLFGVDISTGPTVDIECNLSDQEKTQSILCSIHPDVIIHCAAIKDLRGCQSTRAKAWNSNVGITNAVVQYSQIRPHIKIVYLSSDMVFNGMRGDYLESDIPNPINWYGITKFHSELLVRQLKNFAICRTAMVIGGVRATNEEITIEVGRKILRNQSLFYHYVNHNLQKGRIIYLPDLIVSSPTHVNLINSGIERIILTDAVGVFHLSGSEPISRFRLAKHIASINDLNSKLVRVSEKNVLPYRPRNIGRAIQQTYKTLNLLEDEWNIKNLLRKIMEESFDENWTSWQ